MSRIRSQISYYDLTGGLNNVNTMDTLNSTPKKTESPDMVNVEFFKLGGIKSMEGNTVIGDQQASPVVGGWEYTKNNNKYMIIALKTGELKRLDPITETFVEIYKFAHQSDRVSFCNMNNGVVATNGIDDPVFYEYGRHQILSGAVDVTDGSDEINGTSTDFEIELKPGDRITISGCRGEYRVESITSATKMTVSPVIDTSYIYYQFYDANNAVSVYSLSEVPQIGDTLYSIDTSTTPYTITTAGTVVIAFDPEINNMAYRDTNNVLQSARRTAIHTDITITPATLSGANFYLAEISECNATLVNEDDPNVNTPIRGTAIQYYNGRLWMGTDNGVFYSQVGQYNKWDIKYDAGVLYSIYNDTSKVKALGLYSDYMLIHKEFNTYLLTCTGDSSTIQVRPYSNVSCDSQQSWIVSNTKYYVYSRENMDIFPLSQRTIFSDRYLGEAITNKVRNVFQNLRDADLDNIFCVTLPRKRWMLFYMPMVDQLGSSYALIYDFQCKAFVVRKVPQTVTIAFNYQNEVYIGTEDGLVLKEFIGTSFNGETINAYYKSPWFDWAGDYYQSFAEFALDMASEYNNNFYIRTFKDGDSPYEDRVIDDSSLVTTGLIWDGDTHIENNNTMWDKDVWTSGNFNSIRMLLPNNVFETFQLEIGTNTLGQAFAIYGYNFRRLETEEAVW